MAMNKIRYVPTQVKSLSKKNKELKDKKKSKIKIRKVFSPNIKISNEIRTIRMFNEINKAKEEYEQWLYRRKLIEEFTGKPTLIIGCRGKDGIVLGSDRKVVGGGETHFEDKVKILKIDDVPIIFAAAGFVGIVDDFLEVFGNTLNENMREGRINSLLSVKLLAEDMVKDVMERYEPRLGEESIRFIFGGLSELNKGKARLYEIGAPGFGQKIKYYRLIGHGSSYARTIGKYLFPIERGIEGVPFSVDKISSRIASCIYWIRGEIDDYVGGDPQIVYILDGKSKINKCKVNEKEILDKVEQFKKDLSQAF
jgi:20S proteasome alpha/beta subunit